AGRPMHPVRSRDQSDQVAPSAHIVVLRVFRARAAPGGLRTVPPVVRISVQFVLRDSGRTPSPPGPRPAVPPRRGGNSPVPRTRGHRDGPTAVRPAGAGTRRTGGTGPAPRAATPRVGVDGHQARAVPESPAACLHPAADIVTGGRGTTGMDTPPWRAGRDRPQCGRVRLRQREPP